MRQSLHRILVIDDDQDIQEVVAAVLEDFGGYRVEACSSGAAALERTPIFQPDLILLDMAMPDMDGLLTLQHLRALPSIVHIPVIFFTAKAADPTTLARLPGVVGFIAKPFHHRSLVEHIASLWESHIQLRQAEPDTERLSAIQRDYLLALPQRRALLRTLWATQTYGALAQIQQHVHQLAGSGASLGFAELTATATALELEIEQTLGPNRTLGAAISPAAGERLQPLLERFYQAIRRSHTASPEWPSAADTQHRADTEEECPTTSGKRRLQMNQHIGASIWLLLPLVLCGAISGCMAMPATEAPTLSPAASDMPAPPASPVSFATATAQPAATTTPATSNPDIIAGIQGALDRYAQAYNDQDAELLKQAVDQTNLPFRRFMQTRFEGATQGNAAREQRSFRVRALLKHRPYGFVLARIESGAKVSDVTFRQIDGRWMLSEPTEAQIGERTQVETEHFIFYIYPWLDDINPTIIAAMEQARKNVLERLGKVSDQKAIVHVKPIFGVGGASDPYEQAAYQRNNRSEDRIEISSPQSYAFGFYDPALGWEKALEQILTHEYAHLVTDRLFIPLLKMSDWMVEGLAEYIAELPRTEAVRDVVQVGRIIPIMDTSDSIEKHDLQHLELLDADSDVAYGLAYSLVAYISEQYGGLEGFWKLADAYANSQNLDTSLQRAFGVDYVTFDKGWRAWLNATYQ